jgi:hypothetical protein
MKNKFLLIAFLFISVFACVSEPEFSNVPEIGFSNVQIITGVTPGLLGPAKKDSVIISINFQDGDGDLGFTKADLDSYIKRTKDSSFKSYILDLAILKNGKYINRSLVDERGKPRELLGGNLPFRFKQGQKAGPIEGTIDFSTVFFYNLRGGIPEFNTQGKADTVKFKVQIIDRALNKSNIVESTPVILFAK